VGATLATQDQAHGSDFNEMSISFFSSANEQDDARRPFPSFASHDEQVI
jgi:hypothetical protein